MKKIAWIGTGVMGNAMAKHLMDAGYPVNVFTRSPWKAQNLIDAGAVWFDSVAECVKGADVVFTMVGYPKDVEEVYLGENGILRHAANGTICVDMTTSSPKLAQRLYQEGKTRGIRVLDAPVSGGDVGARNATLAIMVGGDMDAFDEVFPLFEKLGKNIRHMGQASFGQHTKMANQIAVAGAIAATTEAILYAQAAGLDADKMLQAISTGAAGSWQLSNNGPKILKNDMDPGFYIHHFVKDMDLVMEEATGFRIGLPVLNEVLKKYRTLLDEGHGMLGTQALIKAYREEN
jgi:3-hydroxyisobutyrate dehydrogenase/2-hydroxy-3-oxopropionate reductase